MLQFLRGDHEGQILAVGEVIWHHIRRTHEDRSILRDEKEQQSVSLKNPATRDVYLRIRVALRISQRFLEDLVGTPLDAADP